MVKIVDQKEREQEILGLIVEHYIAQSRPISSAFLCGNCRLSYSPATVRNVMLSLEKQGLLSHIHTSSGRVPTKQAFKRYAENIIDSGFAQTASEVEFEFAPLSKFDKDSLLNFALDNLTRLSGYTSMAAISDFNERVFFKGISYMLQQPEFEDIGRLKDIFYALENKMQDIHDLLFEYRGQNLKILIGDEIGFDEIADCSLIISGLKDDNIDFALALLGPMRMDYSRASLCVQRVNSRIKAIAADFI